MIKNQCLGSGASVGGVQGGMRRPQPCPVCGRRVGVRPGRAGRLYPHAAPAEAAPEAERATVTVLHNVDRDASLGLNTRLTSSYAGRIVPERIAAEPADRHPLVAVFRFAAEPGESDPIICARAWVAFNVGEDALAEAYRARRLRSLSVGDVLLIETAGRRRAYACASVGWVRTNLAELSEVAGRKAVAIIRERFQFTARERGLAVTVPLDYDGCFHRCLDGANCGGCGCVGCGYSDTSWPAGRTFGELTPAQRDHAARRACAVLEAELRANAGAIGAAMDAAEAEAEPVTRQSLRDALDANNRAYRTEQITRAAWVARNRELDALGRPLGMSLPPFALADADVDRATDHAADQADAARARTAARRRGESL